MYKFKNISLLFLVFFLLSGCSPKDTEKENTVKNPEQNQLPTQSTVVKSVSVDPKKASIIQIETKNGFSIELRFSENTLFGYGEEKVDTNITLSYSGKKLSGFQTEKDLVFTKPVYIAFDLSSLDENKRYLKYMHPFDENKSYILPSKIENTKIVFEFSHFSNYEFVDQDVSADNATIEAQKLIDELKRVADKTGGIRSVEAKINHLYNLIGLMSPLPTEAAIFMTEANNIANQYVTAFMYQNSFKGEVLDGFVMSSAFRSYFEELSYNHNFSVRITMDDGNNEQELLYLNKVADAFRALSPDNLCVGNIMEQYVNAGLKIAADLHAFAGIAENITIIYDRMGDLLSEQATQASTESCGRICLNNAIDKGLGIISESDMLELGRLAQDADMCQLSLEVDSTGDGYVKLLWAVAEGSAESYTLYYSNENFTNINKESAYSGFEGKLSVTTQGTQFKVDNLENDVLYYFVVSALDINSQTVSVSAVKSATPSEEEDGSTSFKFTKISRDGSVLKNQNASWDNNGSEELGTQWSCIRDDKTGNLWEVKSGYEDLDSIHRTNISYRWGGVGAQEGYTHYFGNPQEGITGSVPGIYYDDWDVLVNGTNSEELCGRTNWSVPQSSEVIALMIDRNVSMERYLIPTVSYTTGREFLVRDLVSAGLYAIKSDENEISYRLSATVFFANTVLFSNLEFLFDYNRVAPSTLVNIIYQPVRLSHNFWFNHENSATFNTPILVWDYILYDNAVVTVKGPIVLVSVKDAPSNIGEVDAGEDLNKVFGDDDFIQSAFTPYEDTTNYYSSSNTTVATVDVYSAQVSIHHAGTTIIKVKNSGNSEYKSSTDSYILVVDKKKQTIDAGFDYSAILDGTNKLTQVASGYLGSGEIHYESNNTAVVSVNDEGVLSFIRVGKAKVTATIEADMDYSSADDFYLVTLSGPTLLNQTIYMGLDVTRTFNPLENNFTQVASTYSGAGEVTYKSSDRNIATVNNEGNVTILQAGVVEITASIGAGTIYNGALDSYQLTINKGSPNLQIIEVATQTKGSDFYFTQDVTYQNSTGTISYSSSNENIATINPQTGLVKIINIGETTLSATITEDVNYEAASASYTLVVNSGGGVVILD